MAAKLTAIGVEKAKADASRRREVPDGGCAGLYLVVQPSGAKSWAFRYRYDGKPKKLSLGPVVSLSASEAEPPGEPQLGRGLTLRGARELAGKQQRLLALGHDPCALKKRQKTEDATIEEVVEDFLTRYVAAHSLRSADAIQRVLRKRVVPAWKGLTIAQIKRRDVIALLDSIVDAGAPVSANRTLAAMRRLFNWCLERDAIAASPCAGVRPPTPETSRSRFLSDYEIRLVWNAADQIGYPFGPVVKLLLLTGQRLNEVAQMRWSELDLDPEKPIWRLPGERVKNGTAHNVPLSPQVISVLDGIVRVKGDPDFVFTTGPARKGAVAADPISLTPPSGFSKAKRRLDAAVLAAQQRQATELGMAPQLVAALPNWRFHDLRRTMASHMAALGVDLPVIERVLNHVSGSFAGVSGVYQRHSYANEKRAALRLWAEHVQAVVTGPASMPQAA